MKYTDEQLKSAYKECFRIFVPGKTVLDDLRRYSRATRIDRDNVNPNTAIYRIAQQELVTYIERMMADEIEHNEKVINGNRNSRSNARFDTV